jgi:DNA-binding response OmpR family regulator
MAENHELVLIVDDEPLALDVMRHVLSAAGFRILDAGSYEEAARVFEAHEEEIDLLLADVSLPGKNGIDLAKCLLKRKPSLRVLFVSGHVTTDRHFLQKPFTSQTLLTRVQEVLKSPDRPWSGNEQTDEKSEAANGE